MHGINEKSVCKWKKQLTDLEKLPAKKQLDGAGRKPTLPDVEELLIL